jgi:phosphoribosylanthranilate isomerase
MWIKICGLTSAQSVDCALALAVDAVGFVFARSSRELTPHSAELLARPARGRLACVAVMRHPTQQQVDEVLKEFRPDLLQTDAADLASLRLPAQLACLPVLRTAAPAGSALPARILFEGAVSGSGTRADWSGARSMSERCELVLAGGLDADNVALAIAQVHPFGVDVSSGVEERPGIKSPAAMEKFVSAVRTSARTAAKRGATS